MSHNNFQQRQKGPEEQSSTARTLKGEGWGKNRTNVLSYEGSSPSLTADIQNLHLLERSWTAMILLDVPCLHTCYVPAARIPLSDIHLLQRSHRRGTMKSIHANQSARKEDLLCSVPNPKPRPDSCPAQCQKVSLSKPWVVWSNERCRHVLSLEEEIVGHISTKEPRFPEEPPTRTEGLDFTGALMLQRLCCEVNWYTF